MNNTGLKTRRHMMDFLFALALFCVFAATALMVVLIGARVYKNTVNGMETNFERRTSLSYVATKIRQFDREGAVSLGELDGIPALVMRQDISGNAYLTMVYHYDGALRELSVREEVDATPEMGAVVMQASHFTMEQPEPGVFRFTSTDSEGRPVERLVSVQSNGEGS